jgi:hypothetical protein
MTIRIKKAHPAFKHAGYSATTILPGESETEYAKLHGDLVREWAPNGALENEVVASMAHLLWRRKNLATFRVAELAQRRMTQIRDGLVPEMGLPKSEESAEFERNFVEKWHAAESQGHRELGDFYALVEMGEEATLDRLMKELEVQERLDAAIDRCIKRLLLVRGVKSMLIGSNSAPPQSLPSPSKAA